MPLLAVSLLSHEGRPLLSIGKMSHNVHDQHLTVEAKRRSDLQHETCTIATNRARQEHEQGMSCTPGRLTPVSLSGSPKVC